MESRCLSESSEDARVGRSTMGAILPRGRNMLGAVVVIFGKLWTLDCMIGKQAVVQSKEVMVVRKVSRNGSEMQGALVAWLECARRG